MKITLAVIGKTEVGFVRQGIEEYVKRLQHYVTFNIQYVGDVKGTRNMSEAQQKVAYFYNGTVYCIYGIFHCKIPLTQ